MTTAVLLFLLSGAVIVVAGTFLTGAADAIAVHTGLGRLWIGVVLLAAATSLPELTTDVAAVRLGAEDLAAGDLFGSSMANMAVLALIGLMRRPGRVFREVTLEHSLTATLAIILNALAAAFVLIKPQAVVLGISPASVLLFFGFLAGMRAVFRNGVRRAAAPVPPEGTSGPAEPAAPSPLRAAGLRFLFSAAAIFIAAPLFAKSATRLAELSGLGLSFVGTALVGLSTSLPELVSSIAAVRLGAFDLAVGNLFGSNSFNMAIFMAMDVALPERSIFGTLSPDHAISALFATILMALGLASIAYRAERRQNLVEPGSVLMLLTYATALLILYVRGG